MSATYGHNMTPKPGDVVELLCPVCVEVMFQGAMQENIWMCARDALYYEADKIIIDLLKQCSVFERVLVVRHAKRNKTQKFSAHLGSTEIKMYIIDTFAYMGKAYEVQTMKKNGSYEREESAFHRMRLLVNA